MSVTERDSRRRESSGAPIVRAFAAHEWRVYRALRLRALADAPDAFGRTLAEEGDRPEAFWVERLAEGATSQGCRALVAELDGRAVGLAWGRIDPAAPDIARAFQMWVAPEARRRGTGQRLLEALVAWARASGARQLALGVTAGDSPATRLYARTGFVPVGEPAPIREGSPLLGRELRLDLGRPAGEARRCRREP